VDINRDGWERHLCYQRFFFGSNIYTSITTTVPFTDKAEKYFKHTALSAMEARDQDIEDINNDGLADVFELDIEP